ncbi:MAG: glucose-1-phosphate cytidylyltransferase [Actinomycetota bacterium]
MQSTTSDIPVVILAGGLGTRLREETERVPKPLVQIGEQPILWHIMKFYGHYGFRRFILCLGYKSWLIKQFFLNYREQLADFTIGLDGDHEPAFQNAHGNEDWEVTCAETGLLTATGARLRRVRRYIDSDIFMFTYGDGIGRVDLRALLDFHRSHGLVGTVTGVHPTSRYGEMRTEGSMVLEFNEKPTKPEGYVSGGFFVLGQEIFDYLNDDPDLFFEREPLQKLARDGQLAVYPHEGYWLGVDTYRDLAEINELWESGEAPWKVWID